MVKQCQFFFLVSHVNEEASKKLNTFLPICWNHYISVIYNRVCINNYEKIK